MITKNDLLNYLGGTNINCARKLGYTGTRADNNINRLPDILTKRQLDAIIVRMKVKRIKVPPHWVIKNDKAER